MKRFLSFLIIVLGILYLPVWQCQQCLAQQTLRGNVLVLNSYHPGFVWTSTVMGGIESCFDNSGYDIKLTIEYMDTKNHTPEDLFDDLLVLYKKKYHNEIYDAIIVVDNNALDFLLKYRDQLFPGIPVVFTGINNYEDSLIAGHDDITGVAEAIDIKRTIDMALDLFPATKDIAVISDVTPTDQANRKLLDKFRPDFEDQVRFVDLAGFSVSQLVSSLKALPKETVVLFFNLYRNPEGDTRTMLEGNNFIAQNCEFPLFTFWDHKMTNGVLGGVVISGHCQGECAADMALKIIDGVSVKQIPVIKISPNVPMFNYDQLMRFGISTSSLPEDSVILRQPYTFFQKYKAYIVGVIVFLALQTLIIILLWINIIARRKAERTLNESEQKFRDMVETTSDWIWEIDKEGKFIYASPKVEEILGYKPEELIGKSAFDLMDSEEAKRVMDVYQEIVDGSETMVAMVNVNKHKDGYDVVMESSGVPVFNNEGNLTGYRGIDRDITERKLAQDSSKRNESELNAIYDNAPLIMLLINRKREIVKLNDKALDFSSKSVDDSVGLQIGAVLNCICASDDEGCGFNDYCHECGIRTALEDVFETGETVLSQDAYIEYANEDGVGQIKSYYKVFATPLKEFDEEVVLICLEDITSQRLSEESLKQNAMQMSTLNLLGEKVNSSLSLDNVIEYALDSIFGVIMPDVSFIFLSEGDKLNVKAQHFVNEKFKHVDNGPHKFGECLCGIAAREKKTTWSVNINEDDRCTWQECKEAGLVSFAAYPLLKGDAVLGVLALGSATERDFSIQSGYLENAANQIAIGLHNAILYQQVKDQAAMLKSEIEERNKAEQALSESEERFSNFFNQGNIGAAIASPEKFWLKVNPKLCSMLGYSEEELTKISWSDLTYTDDLETDSDNFNKLLNAEIDDYEMDKRFVCKDGNVIYTHLTVSCLRNEDRSLNYALATVQDISEKVRTSEALERRLFALTRPLDVVQSINFGDLFNIDDIQKLQDEFADATGVASIITKPDGTPITKPSKFCRLCNDIIRKTEKGCANCYKSDAAIGKLSLEGPTIKTCMSGGLWDAGAGISVGGQHVANWLIGQVRDETQTEEQMREYAREIEVDEEIFIEAYGEVPSMSYQQFNHVAQALFTLAGQLSKSAYQNIQQARFITEVQKAEKVLKNYNAHLESEVHTRTEELVEKNAALENQIEERKKAESELKMATSQLVQSEKLATIGQLAAGVAHEINNPLGAIGSSSGIISKSFEDIIYDFDKYSIILNSDKVLMREIINVILKSKFSFSSRENRKYKQELTKTFGESDISDPSLAASFFVNVGLVDGYQKYIPLLKSEHSLDILNFLQNVYSVIHGTKIIDTAISQSSRVVNALRDFARSDEYTEISMADVRETLDTAMVLYGNMVKHGIKFKLELEDVPPIKCYPHKLCQVWSNLIQNAVQAMGEKGTLAISLKKVDANIQVIVSDTGTGIPGEIKAKIFDPLFSTKPIGEGTGLGLDIVKRIVDRHQGTIVVDSVVGKGTTFMVSLPIS